MSEDKTEERYQGHYLDALDLPEGALVPVEIEAWTPPDTEKDSSGKLIKLGILTFKGKKKRLILGKTSFRMIKAQHGPTPKDWIGKKIHLQRRYLEASKGFGTPNCLCIRVVPPVGTPVLKSALNFMGSPTPYGPDGKPTAPKQAAKATPKQEPAHEPPTNGNGHLTATLAEWKQGIQVMTTLASCEEFRATQLPECPEDIRAAVELFIVNREEEIRKGLANV